MKIKEIQMLSFVIVEADSELKKPAKKQKSARKVKADTTGLDTKNI